MTKLYNVEELLASADFSKAEIAKVQKGEVVNSSNIDTLTERDLATKIAFKMEPKEGDGDILGTVFDTAFLESRKKIESDSNIQQMEVDINQDGTLDFSSLKLLPEDTAGDMVKTYVKFKGGDDLNLSEKEIAMFQALGKNATKEQVEEVLKKVLQGRFDEYKQCGMEGMSPYKRKSKNFFPGKELMEKTEKSVMLKKFNKEFHDYILSWPSGSKGDHDVKETFGWINYNIDGKCSIALYHRVIFTEKEKNQKWIMNRTFYVSSGHNTVQQVGLAVQTDDKHILIAFSSRTSTDKVTGFGGSAKRGIGSRIMGGRIAENMDAVRNLYQKK